MGKSERTTAVTSADSRTPAIALSAQQALHLTSILTDMISRHLLEQEAIAGNPRWNALAYEAHGRLAALHDAIVEFQKAPAPPAVRADPYDDALPEPLDPAVKG